MQVHYIVCCPRSGSTWLRFMLNSHPAISCGPEFELFTARSGLANLIQTYQDKNAHVGFARGLTEDNFIELVRSFCTNLYAHSIVEYKPEATMIVDKSPEHAFYIKEIKYIFPQAKFIYLVRDPRDVAVSICESGRTWAEHFPKNICDSLDMWVRYNTAIVKSRFDADLLLIHYEDMIKSTDSILAKCYQFLGVPLPNEQEIKQIVNNNKFSQLKKLNWHEGNFFRKGQADAWKSVFTSAEVAHYEKEAKNLYEKIKCITPI